MRWSRVLGIGKPAPKHRVGGDEHAVAVVPQVPDGGTCTTGAWPWTRRQRKVVEILCAERLRADSSNVSGPECSSVTVADAISAILRFGRSFS